MHLLPLKQFYTRALQLKKTIIKHKPKASPPLVRVLTLQSKI